jgi:hypothetical protein
MTRVANDFAGLPLHMQAVFYWQFSREAESLAHQAGSPETQAKYQKLAVVWRDLAEALDEENEFRDLSRTRVRVVPASPH